MQYTANTPDEYINQIPENRRIPFINLRDIIKQNLPNDFSEVMSYGMIGWVVPHSIYPSGYHCDPKLPLPFLSIASQEHFIAVYHMGIYADPKLLQWFVGEYPKHCSAKLDMGKSCIRFKKFNAIPISLIGDLAQKMSITDWITLYESHLKN